MTQPDLTNLATVKSWLNLTATGDDGLLAGLITAVSNWIEAYCNRQFGVEDYIESRDGTGGRRMVFGNWPVTAVSTVTIHGRVILPSNGFTIGYQFNERAITLVDAVFPRGLSNIGLAYSAGFAVIPPDLAQAAVELVAFRYRERDRIGTASKGLAGETTAYITKDMPASVATSLQRYRRVVSP